MDRLDKKELRSRFLALRRAIGPEERRAADAAICRNIRSMACYREAEHVALYATDGTEPDLSSLLNEKGKRFYFPRYVAEGNEYELVGVEEPGSELVRAKFGLLEPRPELPAAPEELEAVAQRLDAASSQELWWRCIDCVIPEMRDAVSAAGTIRDVNHFAQTAAAMSQEKRKVYKAVLEGLRCRDLSAALHQADTLDEYILKEGISSPSEFAREKIRTILGKPMADKVLANLNLHECGETLMEPEHCIQTDYGLLQHRDGQEFRIQDKHIGMMEMRR